MFSDSATISPSIHDIPDIDIQAKLIKLESAESDT